VNGVYSAETISSRAILNNNKLSSILFSLLVFTRQSLATTQTCSKKANLALKDNSLVYGIAHSRDYDDTGALLRRTTDDDDSGYCSLFIVSNGHGIMVVGFICKPC